MVSPDKFMTENLQVYSYGTYAKDLSTIRICLCTYWACLIMPVCAGLTYCGTVYIYLLHCNRDIKHFIFLNLDVPVIPLTKSGSRTLFQYIVIKIVLSCGFPL